MENGERKNVYEVYNKIAKWFAENREEGAAEQSYLNQLIDYLPAGAQVLDLGCGTGKPILEYLLSKKLRVTGVDASSKVLEIAKANFPHTELMLADMRTLSLEKKFDGIIAWHSFFHLPADDQPAMFEIFEEHVNPKGILLFTSGTERGEAWGTMGGENVFHASLDTKEYEILLARHSFKILKHIEHDPDCGNATVWMAQRI